MTKEEVIRAFMINNALEMGGCKSKKYTIGEIGKKYADDKEALEVLQEINRVENEIRTRIAAAKNDMLDELNEIAEEVYRFEDEEDVRYLKKKIIEKMVSEIELIINGIGKRKGVK